MGTKKYSVDQEYDYERDPEVIKRRNELFSQYIQPNEKVIRKLCARYTSYPRDFEENFADVMYNFYRGVETYNPKLPLSTWIHICVKRQVWASEKKRDNYDSLFSAHELDDHANELVFDGHIGANALDIDNWKDHLNPDIIEVLEQMNPINRDALIMRAAGYSLQEIAELEFKKGTLTYPSIKAVKSRLVRARNFLKQNLTKDGERLFCQADYTDVL